MKAKIKNRLLLLLLLPALVFASCVMEHEHPGNSEGQSGEYTFMLNVPGSSTATRALSEADEYIVREVDVLVFNNATGRFLYHATAKSLIETLPTAPTEDRKVRFTTTLVKETGVTAYDFVILANSRASVLSALPSLSASSTKADAQAAIVSSVTAGTGWIADAANAAFRPFPMWGEIVNKPISLTENYTASLLRAVAKIDLSVNLGASHAPTDEFVINQVKFYDIRSRA